MAVHKDCYTSLKLTQQGGLNRRKTIAAAETGEQAAKVVPEADRQVRPVPVARTGLIEIDFGSRGRVRVDAQVDADALARVLDVLERR